MGRRSFVASASESPRGRDYAKARHVWVDRTSLADIRRQLEGLRRGQARKRRRK